MKKVAQLAELFRGAFRALARGGEDSVRQEASVPDEREAPLIAARWSVVHVYNAYFLRPVDLEAVCKAAVASGVALAAVHIDGTFWWNAKEGLCQGECILERRGRDSSADLRLPEGLDGFAQQFAWDSANLRFFELAHLSPQVLDRLEYARLCLGPIVVQREGKRVPLYCDLKIHRNGVFQFVLRRLSGGQELSVQALVNDEVNLYRAWFDGAWLPPMIVAPYMVGLIEDGFPGLRGWFTRRSLLQQLPDELAALTLNETIGDWDFLLCQPALLGNEAPDDETVAEELTPPNIDDLRAVMLAGFCKAIGKCGGGHLEHGNYWSSRPQTMITRIADPEPATAVVARERYAHQMGLILARVASAPVALTEKALGPTHRHFDDVSVHLNEAGGLWLFAEAARRGIKLGPNDDELVLASQSKAEFVDYVHAEAHRLAEAAQRDVQGFADVVAVRTALSALDVCMRAASCYGELSEFFASAWRHLKIVDTVEATERHLVLQAAVIEEREGRAARRLGNALAVVFGLVGANALGEKLVEPLLGCWQTLGERPKQLAAAAYLCGCVLVLALVAFFALVFRVPRRGRGR